KGKSSPLKDRRYLKIFYGAMHVFTEKHYKKRAWLWFFWLLRTAVALRGVLSVVMYGTRNTWSALTRLFRRSNTSARHVQILLISGREENCTRVLSLFSKPARQNARQLAIEPGSQHKMQNAKKIATQIKSHPVTHLVFCEGASSFKEIIGLVELVRPLGLTVGIHASCSGGISWVQP
ncbi:MAG: hypothetical protein IT250_13470, partial [Chitinophagaceae bacterium]|nr:hypothetical protein [Chitinophagaceae bacterium]